MKFSDLIPILKMVAPAAPILGTLIGGPFGALAGTLISGALGLPHNTDPSTLSTHMSAIADAGAQIESFEQQHQAALLEMKVRHDQVMSQNVENARHATDGYTKLKIATFVFVAFLIVGTTAIRVFWPEKAAAVASIQEEAVEFEFGEK